MYKDIAINKAYRLINHGPLVLVCTHSKDGQADIAPVAWNCPVECEPTRILLAMAKEHKTVKNIKDIAALLPDDIVNLRREGFKAGVRVEFVNCDVSAGSQQRLMMGKTHVHHTFLIFQCGVHIGNDEGLVIFNIIDLHDHIVAGL